MQKFIQKSIVAVIFITTISISSLSIAQAKIAPNTIVSLVNSARQQSSLNTLSVNSELAAAAQAKANDMIAKGYFAHVSPNGKQPWDFITAAGYNYVYAGENLAIGYTDNQEVFTAWMNSPSHRENILNPNYREIGIAEASGKYKGAETTVVVQEFGSTTETQPVASSVAASETKFQPINPQDFNLVTNQTNFSPNKIFVGDTVNFNISLTGNPTEIYLNISDQKIDLKNNTPTQNGDTKIYNQKVTLKNAGDFTVTVTLADKWGNRETKELGKLTVVKSTIINGSLNSSGFLSSIKNFIINNLGYIVMLIIIMILGLMSWFFLFKNLKHNPKYLKSS